MIGVIVRQDLTGLGVQTRAIAKLLDADRIIAIDFNPINGNKQHLELLNDLSGEIYNVRGWIQESQFDKILSGLKVLITCEIDYSNNYSLVERAKQLGIKTIVVANFEFADWLQRDLPRPDVIANHSVWRNEEFERLLGVKVPVLETPTDPFEYKANLLLNSARVGGRRLLHIAGRKTHLDRNGTDDLLEAVKLIPRDLKFELVVKTQTVDVKSSDPRVIIDSSSPLNNSDLYSNFDAMILPRRYAGGCLPMQEALMSGLPVIMTDIDPNNKILDKNWLVPTQKRGQFMARVMIDVYSVEHKSLADKIVEVVSMSDEDLLKARTLAHDIAAKRFSPIVIKRKYNLLLKQMGVY